MSRGSRKSSSEGSGATGGYGRLPQASRFQLGQSGTLLRGWPEAEESTEQRSVAQMLAAALRRPVVVMENGLSRRLPAQELLFHMLVRDALRGDRYAIHSVLMLMQAFPDAGAELRGAEEDYGTRIREKLDRMSRNLAIERGEAEPSS